MHPLRFAALIDGLHQPLLVPWEWTPLRVAPVWLMAACITVWVPLTYTWCRWGFAVCQAETGEPQRRHGQHRRQGAAGQN